MLEFHLHLSWLTIASCKCFLVLDDQQKQKPQDGDPTSKAFRCPYCPKEYGSQKILKRHQAFCHLKSSEIMQCIDPKNSIYVTTKNICGGIRMPVHVVKGPKSSACEVPLCEDMMAIQARAGNPGFECIHLQRASQPYVRQESLHLESLREMKRQTLMTKHWRKQKKS